MAKKRTVCACYGKRHQRLEAKAAKLMTGGPKGVALALQVREAIRSDIRKRQGLLSREHADGAP